MQGKPAPPHQVGRRAGCGTPSSSRPGGPLESLAGRKLFIMASDDISGDGLRLPGFMAAYGKTAPPKQLLTVEGSAHAQFLFQSDQSDRVMNEILKFLEAR